MSDPMRLDAVVWVDDHALLQGALGHSAAYVLTHRTAPDDPARWDKTDTEVASGLLALEVDPGTAVADFARLALDESGEGRTDVVKVWAEDAVTGQRLPDESVLGDVLESGDLVLVKAEVPPDACYQLDSLGRPEELFDVLHVAAALEVAAWPRLWGALLYTEEDVAVATYVRTHFDQLNAMSGPLLRIFVVERPPDWRRAKKYWRAHLEPALLRTMSVMRWLHSSPYDKSGLYQVARELGVEADHFPCLALFGGDDNDTVVFPIESADPASFRELFASIHRAVGEEPADYQARQVYDRSGHRDPGRPVLRGAAALEALAASASWADRAALARVSAAKKALRQKEFHGQNVVITHGTLENVTIHGPTTFINKPVNTVIKDFQNAHTSAHGARLAEVLRLVLNSEGLPPEERVHVAKRITETVDELESPTEYTRFTVRYALTDIGYLTSRDENIARSVSDIIKAIQEDFA
ncbi:hypothetical protein AB0I60_26745 [Actinosynnema sp. NPDC050436]|uniref:hypothetical protein n=1 Tax=Actinosynnema sp. NPDC050436 TaxID=3155659 RepID=UPI003404E88D